MKKTFFTALALLSLFSFFSCENENDESVIDYDISEIYGYTYYGNITASSGNTLIPSIILYNDERCDWNMSVNGMNNNQFYYYAVKNSAANYTLYWFAPSEVSYCAQKDSSKASMVVQIGINSPNELVILLTGDEFSGVSNMTNTRVPMTKQNSIEKNTTPTEITLDADVEDISIEIPSFATAANWAGNESYTGTYGFLVIGGNDTYLATGQGTATEDENGNLVPTSVKIKDTSALAANTVTVTTNPVSYTEQMSVGAFDIEGVQVKKNGEVYYLYKESTTITTETQTLNEVTLVGKLENGILTWRVSFKPGAMPFPIVEIFESESGD